MKEAFKQLALQTDDVLGLTKRVEPSAPSGCEPIPAWPQPRNALARTSTGVLPHRPSARSASRITLLGPIFHAIGLPLLLLKLYELPLARSGGHLAASAFASAPPPPPPLLSICLQHVNRHH